MRVYVVHLLKWTGLRNIAACGLWAYNHGVNTRRHVTCKRCLRTRRAAPHKGKDHG